MPNNTNTRVITGCIDCPFRFHEYDDYALGHDTIESCNLAVDLNLDEYFIDSYDTKNQDELTLKTPKWCPLKNNSLLLTFKNEV